MECLPAGVARFHVSLIATPLECENIMSQFSKDYLAGRRNFLKRSLSLSLLTATGMHAGNLFAAPATQNRFLLVFLRGGYDAANLLVPYSSSFYYESRPTIAIAKPDPKNMQSGVALDGNWALHPSLRDSIAPFYTRKEALFMPFSGTDDLTRSHFETQDSIELGQTISNNRSFSSGFMNRLSQVIAGSQPISFTDALPTIFKGETNVANVSLKGVGKPPFDARQSAILADMYAGHPLEDAVREGLDLRQEVGREIDKEMQAANRDAITPKGFELEARRMARLMRERYQLGFVDVGGWDTHVNEGGASGALAGNLDNLGRGLSAFAQEMGTMWKQTVVVVISEFGRTFRENGTRGTDHGHGTVYWVLGGGINGGRIAGEQTRVDQASLFQNRDFPVLNDYRAVLGGLFKRMYGLSNDDLQIVFPGTPSRDYSII
jgi:uncharacterized protein (DUF1501 family)